MARVGYRETLLGNNLEHIRPDVRGVGVQTECWGVANGCQQTLGR